MNRTLLFGEGLFETIRWKGGTNKLPLHHERLKSSAKAMGLPYPSYGEFLEAIKKKAPHLCALKVLVAYEGGAYYPQLPESYTLKVFVRELREPPSGVVLGTSPYRRHSSDPTARHKSTSYLFNLLVKREALRRGLYDGIVLNERDELCETSSANLLLYRKGKFYTPDPESGLLYGTTLRFLEEELSLKKEPLTLRHLEGAYLFLVNSLTGFVPVVELEGRKLP
ncbi:MAG: aminotransferase class IV, partial [Aquificae bacterium]|nr:aminotransferase class IV [Aquificota bacterium]